MKLDADGNFQWIYHPESTGQEIGYGIATSPDGNSYITGWFQEYLRFGKDTTLTVFGSSDIVEAKFDTDGKMVWVQQAGNVGIDYGFKIDVDSVENSYVTGVADAYANFGGMFLPKGGMYVAKYTKDGAISNLLSCVGTGGNNIAVAKDGTGYVTGRFGGTVNFDTTTLVSVKSNSYFASFGNNWRWAKQMSGHNMQMGRSVNVDNEGNAYFVGTFFDTAQIANFATFYSHASSEDIYITSIDKNANYLWALQLGADKKDNVTDIVISDDKRVFITGFYTGNTQIGDYQLTANNTSDDNFYVAGFKMNTSIENTNFENNKNRFTKVLYHTDNIQITSNAHEFSLTNSTIKIFNSTGQNILNEKINNNSFSIDTKTWKSGIYIYQIKNKYFTENGKFVILCTTTF